MDKEIKDKIKWLYDFFQEFNEMKKVRDMDKSSLEAYMMSIESIVKDIYLTIQEEETK